MSHRTFRGAVVVPAGAALAIVGSALAFAAPSQADDVTITMAPPAPASQPAREAVTGPPPPETFKADYETRPNLALIGGGAIAFGASYGIAAMVAASSSHQGDDQLSVPVLGPWLDLADRGSCGMTGGRPCDMERGDKIGLAVDGVFQAVGVLAIVGGFVLQRKRDVMTRNGVAAPKLEFAPVHYAHGGMGLAASGTF